MQRKDVLDSTLNKAFLVHLFPTIIKSVVTPFKVRRGIELQRIVASSQYAFKRQRKIIVIYVAGLRYGHAIHIRWCCCLDFIVYGTFLGRFRDTLHCLLILRSKPITFERSVCVTEISLVVYVCDSENQIFAVARCYVTCRA